MDPRGALTVADLGVVDYDAALAMQTAMLAARLDGRVGDTLLMMEHPHVFTLGRGADERFIVANPAGAPIRRVSRGGQVTYHGPGQLVGYPILKLEGRDRDVTKYLRDLEAAMIDALAEFGIDAVRRDAMTGVWVGVAQDRVDRRRHPALDHLARLRAERLDRSELLRLDRAVRYRRMPHDFGLRTDQSRGVSARVRRRDAREFPPRVPLR